MKKIVFRAFIYSFAVSLLVIFSINKLQAYFPQKIKPSEAKVTGSNITSFIKNDAENVAPVVAAATEEPVYSAEALDNEDFEKEIVVTSAYDDSIEAEPLVAVEVNDLPQLETQVEYDAHSIATGNNPSSREIPIQKTSGQLNLKAQIADAPTDEIAMTQNGDSLKGMTDGVSAESNSSSDTKENPWVVAKGVKFPSNQMVADAYPQQETLEVKKESMGNEVKVAEMVRNILIPIPEDIIKEGDVTPQLISSDKNKRLQEKIEQKEMEAKERNVVEEPAISTPKNAEEKEGGQETGPKKKTIFDSISSIFSSKTPEIGVANRGEQKTDSVSSLYTIRNNKKDSGKVTKILPTEIKLSFQPNRAEISGQTLKWIEAFANKTIEDDTVILEIRIDGTSSFELQQKRLGLLHDILRSKGVEYGKINTVFTTREPNSFIVRTVRINDRSVADGRRANNASRHYQDW